MVIAALAALAGAALAAPQPAACWVEVRYDSQSALPSDPPAPAVVAVDASPVEPAVLLIATRPGALFRSTDDGRTWSAVTAGLEAALGWINIGPNPKSLRFDPHRPGRVYLGVETQGVYISNDHGATWRRESRGLTGYRLNGVSFGFPGAAVLLGSDGGLDRWVEAARRWVPVRAGLPEGGTISAIATGANGEAAAIYYASAGAGGLFLSANPAERWRRSPGLPTGKVRLGASGPGSPAFPAANGRSVAINPFDRRELLAGTFAGILRSTDGGESWTVVRSGPLAPYAIAYDPSRPGLVYAGGRHAMLVSTDSGRSWRSFERGLTGRVGRHSAPFHDPAPDRNLVTAFDLLVTSEGSTFAATDAGLFRADFDPTGCPS